MFGIIDIAAKKTLPRDEGSTRRREAREGRGGWGKIRPRLTRPFLLCSVIRSRSAFFSWRNLPSLDLYRFRRQRFFLRDASLLLTPTPTKYYHSLSLYSLKYIYRTLGSVLSRSFAISCSDGNPPAVTSDASVKVQYDSLLFVVGGIFRVGVDSLLPPSRASLYADILESTLAGL